MKPTVRRDGRRGRLRESVVPALLAALLAGAFGTLAVPVRAGGSDTLFAELLDADFDAALERARADNKLLLIHFYTDWCPQCKVMSDTTFSDPLVIAWVQEQTIPMRVHAERELQLAARFRVRAYPMTYFLNPDQGMMGLILGYKDASGFLGAAVAAAAGSTWLGPMPPPVPAMTPLPATRPAPLVDKEEPPPPPPLAERLTAQLDAAKAKAAEGANDDALAGMLTVLDALPTVDRFEAGQVPGLTIDAIATLGVAHAPALEALRARRAAFAAPILAKRPTFGLVRLATGIDRSLGEPARSLELVDALHTDDGRFRNLLRLVEVELIDTMHRERRYDLLLSVAGGLEETVLGALEIAAENRAARGERTDMPLEGDLPERAGQCFEALLATGERMHAELLARDVLAVEATPGMYARLIGHARRAGFEDVATDLIAKGCETFPGDPCEHFGRATFAE